MSSPDAGYPKLRAARRIEFRRRGSKFLAIWGFTLLLCANAASAALAPPPIEPRAGASRQVTSPPGTPQQVTSTPQDQVAAREDEDDSYINITTWRFARVENPDADLRGLDANRARTVISDALRGDPESVEGATTVFRQYSFEQLQALISQGAVTEAQSRGLAEARREMTRRAMALALEGFEPPGRYDIGYADSGNMGSHMRSDVDQSVFLIDLENGKVVAGPDDINRFNEAFAAAFFELFQVTPAQLAIENMNGADFFPDWRQQHSILEFDAEARRVVIEKSSNPEAYRAEGTLVDQAERRGYESLQQLAADIERLDNDIARLRAQWDDIRSRAVDPRTGELRPLDPDEAARGQRIINELRAVEAARAELSRFSPWTYVTRNADGDIVVIAGDDPSRRKVLPVEPNLEERYSFDGAYDNWFMFENHPDNQAKYLLRSVRSVGFGRKLDRPGVDAPVAADPTYDFSPGRAVVGYDYDEEYARSNHELNAQFINDVYGDLPPERVRRIQRALDAAAMARLKHKGVLKPDGSEYTEYDVYAEYMSNDTRFPAHMRLVAAKSAWAAEAREIMIENMMRTVGDPGRILQGDFTPGELARIAETVRRQAPDAPVDPEVLRRAAELQIFHAVHDLISIEHARALVEDDPVRREELRDNPERLTDLVDRLFEAAERAGGTELRARVEAIAREAAAERVNAELGLRADNEGRSFYERLTGLMERHFDAASEAAGRAYDAVEQRYNEGYYSKERVALRLISDLTGRFGDTVAETLDSLGFQGEVKVLFPTEDYPTPVIDVEFGQPVFSGAKLVDNLMSSGNLDSALQVVDAYLGPPPDVEAGAWAAAREVVMNVPGVAQVNAVWDLVAHGRPQGAFMMGTAMFIPGAGQAYTLVSIATNTVKIAGKLVVDPLRDDNADMIYQGYLAAGQRGFLITSVAFAEDLRSQRDDLLKGVEIRVIPYTPPGPDGEPATTEDGEPQIVYAIGPYSNEDAWTIDPAWSEADLDFARLAGVLGGGDDWNEQLRRASNQAANPALNFDARRASLFYHYEDAVDDYLCRRGRQGGLYEGPCVHNDQTETIETLFTTHGAAGATAELAGATAELAGGTDDLGAVADINVVPVVGFFRDIVDDWLYRRDAFADSDGGANQVLVDRIAGLDRPDERNAFLNRLAVRMAGDFLYSYQLLRHGSESGFQGPPEVLAGAQDAVADLRLPTGGLNRPIAGAPVMRDASWWSNSIEGNVRRNVDRVLEERARFRANQRMIANEEARRNARRPELAGAVHEVIDNRFPRRSAPRIRVRPRIVPVGGIGQAAPGTPVEEIPAKVNLLVSVIAAPDRVDENHNVVAEHPGPYTIRPDEVDYLMTPDELGVDLSVRVTVRDANGNIVGEPTVARVGYLLGDESELELEPLVPSDPSVSTCVLRADAPNDFPVEDAIDYCDSEVEGAHEYDRLAVFFTPARDMRPIEGRPPFQFRVVNANGLPVWMRTTVQESIGDFAPGTEGSLPFAKEGSPAALAVVVDLWDRDDDRDPATGRTGPGTYAVQTMGSRRDVGSEAFGGADAGVTVDGEWQDEGTFAVAPGRLHFQGFVAEQVRDMWIQDNPRTGYGTLTVGDPRINGSTVTVEAAANWTAPGSSPPASGGDVVLAGFLGGDEVGGARSVLTMDFPAELAPGHEEMGDVTVRLEAPARGELFFTAGMHLPVPVGQAPPDRHLVEGVGMPAAWAPGGGDDVRCTGSDFTDWTDERFDAGAWRQYEGNESDTRAGYLTWMWPRQAPSGDCTVTEVSVADHDLTLLAGDKDSTAGSPERALADHLRDPETLWVIPVFLNLTDDAAPARRALSMKTYGYAIYAVEPGTYTAPLPAAAPEQGSPPPEVTAADAESQGDPSRDPAQPDPVTGDPDSGVGRGTPVTDPSSGAPGAIGRGGDTPPVGGGGAIDPSSLDPSAFDIARYIRQWLRVAEPPENASGANFRYDPWGRKIGSAAPGRGRTVGEAPPPAGGGSPEAFAWSMRAGLDSIDHCTLEEYVVISLNAAEILFSGGEPYAHCAGRIARTAPAGETPPAAVSPALEPTPAGEPAPATVSPPPLVGLTLPEAQEALRDSGLEMAPILAGPAPTPEQAHRIAAQRQAPTEQLAPGSVVDVAVYSDYQPVLTDVPILEGQTLADAQQLAQQAGLTLMPSLLGAAPSPELSNRVAAQRPAGLAQVAQGSNVEVDVYSAYVAPAPPPDPVPRRDPPPDSPRRDPEPPPPPAAEVTGPYGLRCPATAGSMPLSGQYGGYTESATMKQLQCVYQYGAGTEQVFWVRWEDSSSSFDQWDADAYCQPNRRDGNFIYLFSGSKLVRGDTKVQYVDEQWAISVMQDMINRVEPYARSCGRPQQ